MRGKFIKITAIIVALIAVGLFSYWGIVSSGKGNEEHTRTDNRKTVESSVQASESKGEKMDEIPSESTFMQMIHEMSHQKVNSHNKWGHLEITEERINSMLEILENAEYGREDLYYEILSEWKEGNFRNAVYHHNRIWAIQGGTVGKASELLTKREEQKYIEKHFR